MINFRGLSENLIKLDFFPVCIDNLRRARLQNIPNIDARAKRQREIQNHFGWPIFAFGAIEPFLGKSAGVVGRNSLDNSPRSRANTPIFHIGAQKFADKIKPFLIAVKEFFGIQIGRNIKAIAVTAERHQTNDAIVAALMDFGERILAFCLKTRLFFVEFVVAEFGIFGVMRSISEKPFVPERQIARHQGAEQILINREDFIFRVAFLCAPKLQTGCVLRNG